MGLNNSKIGRNLSKTSTLKPFELNKDIPKPFEIIDKSITPNHEIITKQDKQDYQELINNMNQLKIAINDNTYKYNKDDQLLKITQIHQKRESFNSSKNNNSLTANQLEQLFQRKGQGDDLLTLETTFKLNQSTLNLLFKYYTIPNIKIISNPKNSTENLKIATWN